MSGSLAGLDTGLGAFTRDGQGSHSLSASSALLRVVPACPSTPQRAAAILALVLCVAPVRAEEPTPLRWPSHAAIPARISDAAVAANLALDGWHAFRAEDRTEALTAMGCRLAVTAFTSELLKRLVSRTRPNGQDALSFPSMHTALASASAGYQRPWGASLALTVGWGRQAGGFHYASDVAVGAGLGWLSRKVC